MAVKRTAELQAGRPPRILLLITEDWFFCSHFFDRALAARDAGYEVFVLAREGKDGARIRAAGIHLWPIGFQRRGLNPLVEMGTLRSILKAYRKLRPDIVHHVGMKPILYGSIAARLTGLRNVVNAPVGMGYVFSSADVLARCIRPFLSWGLARFLNPCGSKVVFENGDDLADFVANGTVRCEDAVLIRGAGVDITLYRQQAHVSTPPVVILVARMLYDKGIQEFVDAAGKIAKTHAARFVLVGAPDPGNPGAIPEQLLRRWSAEGVIEWLGHRSDIPKLLMESAVVCLPSYREGLPKSLIEALAAGKPIVTTDVPGCREVVAPGINGLLVPARDAQALAVALRELLDDPARAVRFGLQGRLRAEREFSTEIVNAATMRIYRDLLLTKHL